MVKSPKSDEHGKHIWFLEPKTTHGVLTEAGVGNIVHHKYTAGRYTKLDNVLNPMWFHLTNLLPMWLAPNAVSAIGTSFNLLSYIVSANASYDFSKAYPGWLLVFNGVCLATYYTLDCMDGKQARRTNSSTPMGQLFDHGLDCLGNLSQISLLQGIFGIPASRPFLALQGTIQIGFYQAQLEEYYTGTLPHATGDFGITEILYGLSLISILRGLGVLGDDSVLSQPLPEWANLKDGLASYVPGACFFLERESPEAPADGILQLREGLLLLWIYSVTALVSPSLVRITNHILKTTPKESTYSKRHLLCSALSKLVSPVVVFLLSLQIQPLAPELGGVRYPSLVFGLAYCMVTIKVIVLGMAHMPYASVQWADLLPVFILVGLDLGVGRETYPEIEYAYPVVAVCQILRLLWWTRQATGALCQALKINVFTIPYPPKGKDQ